MQKSEKLQGVGKPSKILHIRGLTASLCIDVKIKIVMSQLNIRIDEELKNAFIKKAKENNTSATELLIEYMKQYLISPAQKTESQKIEEMDMRLHRVEQMLGELAA